MLGIDLDRGSYARIFSVLSRGDGFITSEEFGQLSLQSVSQGFDVALTAQYENNGFARAQYVLNEVREQWERDELLPFPERLGRTLATFWDRAESLSDFAEFLVGLTSLVVALRSIGDQLNCLLVPGSASPGICDKVDIGNLIPLVFLLRKSVSDVWREISENYVQDLDQDSAVAFASVFKPTGMKLAAFMSIRAQGAEWRTIPLGGEVPYATMAAGDSLHLIVRGSMRLVAQGNVAGLSETVAVLKAGSFIGGAQFVEAEDGLVSGRRSSSLIANESVQLLEWKSGAKLKAFLRVHESLQTEFTSAIVRSMTADMSQVTKQAKMFSFELPVVFRNFKAGPTGVHPRGRSRDHLDPQPCDGFFVDVVRV
ncbi:unnamed protein product [Prorocentrum cordatum]|uniref:Cyclic nucleotide-binding domain-containing protein n=1 Tax=Prorocentrum cordatum TaxID=2364126 RepID=A0ABN9UPW1_9DINO|nr:unnamed protein product [Polarella glacialis]